MKLNSKILGAILVAFPKALSIQNIKAWSQVHNANLFSFTTAFNPMIEKLWLIVFKDPTLRNKSVFVA